MKLFFAHLMTLDDNDYVLTFASPIIDFIIDWTIYDQATYRWSWSSSDRGNRSIL